MSGAREIRQRIAAVGKTRQITSAMQRIAYIRMGRAQQRARQVRPYSQSLFRIVARMLEQHQDHRSPLMAQRVPAHRVGMIVVTTDKGLCGALNTRLLHMCITQMLSWQAAGREVSVTVIGARGLGAMRRAGARIVAQAVGVADLAPDDVTALMGAVAVPLHQFIDGRIDELFVATNRFINALSFEPVLARILPFSRELAELPAVHAGEVAVPYLYEPEPGPVIDALLLRYVETVIYRAIVENAACEQSARMTAMKAATDNADHMIDELTHQYHKSRQEAITRELAEIVAGADALRSG